MVQQVNNNIPTPYNNAPHIFLPHPDQSWSIKDRNKCNGIQAQLIFDLWDYAQTSKIDNETPTLQKLMGTRKTDQGEQFTICSFLVQAMCIPIESPRIRAAAAMALINYFSTLQDRKEFPLKTVSMFVTISSIMLEEALNSEYPTKRLSEIDDFPLLVYHSFHYQGPEIKKMPMELAETLLAKEIHRRGFDKCKIDHEKFGDHIVNLLEKKLVEFKKDKDFEKHIKLYMSGITIHDKIVPEEKSEDD